MTELTTRLRDRLSQALVYADGGELRTAANVLTQMAAELTRAARAQEILTDGETLEDTMDRDGLADHQAQRAGHDYRQQIRQSFSINTK